MVAERLQVLGRIGQQRDDGRCIQFRSQQLYLSCGSVLFERDQLAMFRFDQLPCHKGTAQLVLRIAKPDRPPQTR